MLKSVVDDLSAFALSLLDRAKEPFSPPLHWTLFANGDADFHDNVIFFGYDDSHIDPILVAKVPRLAENGWMLKTEYERLAELWNCLGEEAARYVPKPYGITILQGRPALVISYLPGDSLARLSHRSFWNDSEQASALASEAARTLRDLNRLTARPRGDVRSPDSRFPEEVAKFRDLFRLQPQEDQLLSELMDRVKGMHAIADHEVLLQGDFWHGNMIRDKERQRLMLVDWQFARWSTDASMDVYFFLLAAVLSATKHAVVRNRALAAFQLLEQWQAKLIPAYLSAYGQPDHYGLLPPKYGMMFCCVEKAVRSALDFGYHHPDDAVWRYLFAELMNWPDET
jgi:aminoglycoside phosphotransferase (APT) family kinase protein